MGVSLMEVGLRTFDRNHRALCANPNSQNVWPNQSKFL